MSNIFPSFVQAHPSYVMPEIIMQYAQASGFQEMLAGGDVMARLGEGDLFVYAKKLELRTKVAGGQVAYEQLPSVTVGASPISTPTYLLRARAEYSHHDTAAAGKWGVSLPEAQRLGMRQAIFQQMRTAALFGMGQATEGLVNTTGATASNLPADTNGNTTISTYDNGQMAFFLLQLIAGIKQRTFQVGGKTIKIVILAPQRVITAWAYYGIVQLTQFQRVGGGVASVAGTVEEVMHFNGDDLRIVPDDTLQGAGAGGNDLILIGMPELNKPDVGGINTNVFAGLSPGMTATTVQLCDMPAPREIPTPLPGGALDVLSELRITPGWCIRPEALTILSAPF